MNRRFTSPSLTRAARPDFETTGSSPSSSSPRSSNASFRTRKPRLPTAGSPPPRSRPVPRWRSSPSSP
eukprot:6074003-Lingulodinium_polyedra.AAC.1